MTTKNIGVFFGSRSAEHDVSILTAQVIINGLKKMGHVVHPVYISKAGNWYIHQQLGSLKFFKQFPSEQDLEKLGRYYIDMRADAGRMIFKSAKTFGKDIVIDLAFPAFHGTYGEDGTAQGLFELLNIPYVGCGVAASALAMDKILAKQLYLSQGIPTTKFIPVMASEWTTHKDHVLEETANLTFPLFVKPARLGSSIGITKVKEKKDLEFAVEVALHYDYRVIVEEGVQNLVDITCAVMGNDNPEPSLLQESLFTADFFDYEEKYLQDGGTQLGNAQKSLVIPAQSVNEQQTKHIQDQAMRIYKLVGCSGIARIDFLYDKQSAIAYANEINPLPGTLYEHLWKKSGVELPQLLEKLLDFAEERHEAQKQYVTTFESNILEQANSAKLGSKSKT